MEKWKYLTNDEKENHELYRKKTAFSLFMIYLAFQCFISAGSAAGAYADYSTYLRDYNYELIQTTSTGTFVLVAFIPSIYIFLSLILFKYYGKSKRTVILFTIFLITFPIVSLISNIFLVVKYNLDPNAVVPKMLTLFLLFIFFGIIFYIYSIFSKPFNIQYLNRVKS